MLTRYDTTHLLLIIRNPTDIAASQIMVLDAGRIIEFDSPAALLRKESGAFKSLVDESGDRDALYVMAKGK
jgi:ABC-type multidrug transport system fused ATPase/permease subunit